MLRGKILLIQFREGETAKHEQKCFLEKSGLNENELYFFNALKKPLRKSLVKKYDAIFLGGSGDCNVSKKNYPHRKEIKEFIKYCFKENKPLFAFCFGFHLVVEAMGGKMAYDLKYKEVGTYKITLTKAGQKSLLFEGLPKSFKVQEGHQDVVVKKPKGAINLASTSRNQWQVFTWPGTKIYAVQFHPELDKKDVYYRLDYFSDLYVQEAKEFEKIRKNTEPTPLAPKVIINFLKYIV